MPREYKLYLEDILRCIHKIQEYTNGKKRKDICTKEI